MARPLKLTPQRQKRLADALAVGNTYENACAAAGIDYATFRRWMVRGEAESRGQFSQFCEVITRAEAEAEHNAITIIRKAAETDWRAAVWWLERRFPHRWGKRARLSVTQRTEGQLTVQHAMGLSTLQHSLMPSVQHVE